MAIWFALTFLAWTEFNLHDHIRSLRRQKRYNRQWKQVKIHPRRLKNFTYHRPNALLKDVRPFRTPWLIYLICLVVGMELFTSKWVSKSIGRSMTWMTTLMAALVLHHHCQQSTRTYRSFVSTHGTASKLPTSVRFDTDSFRIGIDFFVYACMSPNREHFTSYKEERGHECKGILIRLNIAGQGTLNFNIDNDNGRTHYISVLDTVHIP